MKLICNFLSFLNIFVTTQEKWQIKYGPHWVLQLLFEIFFSMITYNTTTTTTRVCTNSTARQLWRLKFLWWRLEFSSIILLPVHDPLRMASKIICSFLSFIPYVSLSTPLLSPLLFSHSFYLSILSLFLSSLPTLLTLKQFPHLCSSNYLFIFFLPYSFLIPIIVLFPIS
jgi:hypothetical protein